MSVLFYGAGSKLATIKLKEIFTMGWQIQWGHKPWETVDGNTLRQYASDGTLTLDTPVKSLIKGKTVRAGDIAGLFSAPALPATSQIDNFAMVEPAWVASYARKSVPKRSRPGLFDVRFQSFLTVDLVSLAWQFSLWFIAFGCVLQVVLVLRYIPLSSDVAIKTVQIMVAVCVSLASGIAAALVVRVVLEAIVVLFKIEEHLRKR